jgi:hypothetical protein
MTEKNKPLPNDAVVFRAIKSKSWVSQDDKLLPVAFFRLREKDNDGVSVSQSAQNCTKLLNKIKKVARIKVAEIRTAKLANGDSLNLDVIDDPTDIDPLHALITNIPFYYGSDMPAGLDAAQSIVACPSLCIVEVSMIAT